MPIEWRGKWKNPNWNENNRFASDTDAFNGQYLLSSNLHCLHCLKPFSHSTGFPAARTGTKRFALIVICCVLHTRDLLISTKATEFNLWNNARWIIKLFGWISTPRPMLTTGEPHAIALGRGSQTQRIKLMFGSYREIMSHYEWQASTKSFLKATQHFVKMARHFQPNAFRSSVGWAECPCVSEWCLYSAQQIIKPLMISIMKAISETGSRRWDWPCDGMGGARPIQDEANNKLDNTKVLD